MIINNFSRDEFRCKDLDRTPVPDKYDGNLMLLMTQCQIIRNHVGHPVKVLSGYRTPKHNHKVGGAPSSRHLYAQAADLQVQGMDGPTLHSLIINLMNRGKLPFIGGVGVYDTFVHVDVRAKRARWSQLSV